MSSRAFILSLGLVLAACGPQSQSEAAANDGIAANAGAEAPIAEPTLAPTPDANAAAAQPQDQGTEDTRQSSAGVIREILVQAGTFDGARITGFELRGRCETIFTTANGATTIDWTGVKDWAARLEGGQRLIPIDDGKAAHVVGVPAEPRPEPIGNAGARVEGGLGLIADECQR